jgi:hypothetical protein
MHNDNSGYQHQNNFNSLPTQHQQQSKSNDDISRQERDISFESWLNDESSSKPSNTAGRSTFSKKTGNTNSSGSSKSKPTPAPAPNLINFDDEKWADDDDAGWESIDTK